MKIPSEMAEDARKWALDMLVRNKADLTAQMLLECSTELKYQIVHNLRLEAALHKHIKEKERNDD